MQAQKVSSQGFRENGPQALLSALLFYPDFSNYLIFKPIFRVRVVL